jgi:hypothetical protein
MKNNEQIGVGISPGDGEYESPYLYVNPYPFDEKMVDQSFAIGKWLTTGWSGIKVEWKELEDKIEQEITSTIYDLFLVAKRNFRCPAIVVLILIGINIPLFNCKK